MFKIIPFYTTTPLDIVGDLLAGYEIGISIQSLAAILITQVLLLAAKIHLLDKKSGRSLISLVKLLLILLLLLV
jgi:hypothetical protein